MERAYSLTGIPPPLLFSSIHLQPRHCGKQRLGVLVGGGGKNFVRLPVFHDAALAHHGNTVRNVMNHGQIMGNEDHGQVQVAGQSDEKVQNLGLDGDVQRRNGFIRNEQPGVPEPRHARWLRAGAGLRKIHGDTCASGRDSGPPFPSVPPPRPSSVRKIFCGCGIPTPPSTSHTP